MWLYIFASLSGGRIGWQKGSTVNCFTHPHLIVYLIIIDVGN